MPAPGNSFYERSGRLKRSFTPKPKYNYKPRLHHKKKNVLYVSDHHKSVNDSLSENAVVHEVALSDKRCYDNLLRVKIGHVKTIALVDTGASISCISHNLLCKIQPKQVQYLPGDISQIFGVGNIVQDVSDKVRFNFHIDQDKFNHDFYAIQNQYPLILGMDFINNWNGVLDFEHSTIKLKDEIYDLIPPPCRSTLVKSKHAQIIDAYASSDICIQRPVCLTRSVETACMLVEQVSSLTCLAPRLEMPISVVSSQSTACRILNNTYTPISIPAGCVVAIARNVCLENVTEMIDFIDKESGDKSHVHHADGENNNDFDFNEIMPFPEYNSGDDNADGHNDAPDFEIDNPKLTAHETAQLITFLVKNKKVFASTLAKLGHSTE